MLLVEFSTPFRYHHCGEIGVGKVWFEFVEIRLVFCKGLVVGGSFIGMVVGKNS